MKKAAALLCILCLVVLCATALAEYAPPQIPPGDLAPADVSIHGAGKYAVYSGPGENYLRAANGKASVSMKGWVQCFGTENGWTLIQYEVAHDQYRFGWVKDALTDKELNFESKKAETRGDVWVTDDPLGGFGLLAQLPMGEKVVCLARMGYVTYIECMANGVPVRGFVSSDMLGWEDGKAQYAGCLYAIRKNGLAGYMNYAGEIVLEPRWDYASDFRGPGYARVGTDLEGKRGDTNRFSEGIIDKTGAYVVEPRYSIDEGYDGSYYGGKDNGVMWLTDESGLDGFFDIASGCFSGIKYRITIPWVGRGRLIAVDNPEYEKWWLSTGFADRTTGELVIPYLYCIAEGTQFVNGFAYVEAFATGEEGEKPTPLVIDEKGEQLPFKEGMIPFNGEHFYEGRRVVMDRKTGLYGYADTTGKLVIEAKYEKADGFYDGLADVTLDGEEFCIDRDGKRVNKRPEDPPFGAWLYDTDEHIEGHVVVGLQDANGNVLVDPKEGYCFDENYSFGYLYEFTEGLQVLVKKGKYGFLNEAGEVAIPFEWDYAENFVDGLCYVEKDGKMAYLNHDGLVVYREE